MTSKKLFAQCSKQKHLILILAVLTIILTGCFDGMGASKEDLIVNLSPQKDIVVTEGQSVQFSVVTTNDQAAKFFWTKYKSNGMGVSLYDLNTATVSVSFTLEDDGGGISVGVKMPNGATASAGTGPIKVVPK
jgi:thiamine transporter ThiT